MGFHVDRRWCSVGSAPPSLKRSCVTLEWMSCLFLEGPLPIHYVVQMCVKLMSVFDC